MLEFAKQYLKPSFDVKFDLDIVNILGSTCGIINVRSFTNSEHNYSSTFGYNS